MAEGLGGYPPHIEGKSVSYTTYANYGCRCEGCTVAHREEYNRWRNSLPAERKKELNARTSRAKDRRVRELNDELALHANKSKAWTEREIAIALDRSITVRQAAEMLGRTIYAVKSIRNKYR
jgi:hypothetical protein